MLTEVPREALIMNEEPINHFGLALPVLRFGGVKDSGYGSEGGADPMEAYYVTKLITQMNM